MSDGKPKHKFLHDVYNTSVTGGEAREAITNKMLKSLPGRKTQHPKDAAKTSDYAQPKEDIIADYARLEKTKAEALAEQKWRQKFDDWQAEQVAKKKHVETSSTDPAALNAGSSEPQGIGEGLEIQQKARSPANPESMEHLSSAQDSPVEVDSLRRRVEIAERTAAQLCDERDRFKQELDDLIQDLQNRNQELWDEKETASGMESRILQLDQERDSWENRVKQRNTQMKQVAAVRQDVMARMTTLGGRIKDMTAEIVSSHADSLADPSQDPGDPPDDVLPPA